MAHTMATDASITGIFLTVDQHRDGTAADSVVGIARGMAGLVVGGVGMMLIARVLCSSACFCTGVEAEAEGRSRRCSGYLSLLNCRVEMQNAQKTPGGYQQS